MRTDPRIGINALCWELDEDGETHGKIIDLSPLGARLERPFIAGKTRRCDSPLLLDVPGIDEVLWARGEVIFDRLVPSKATSAGPFGLVRRTGYRIVTAATRDLKMLRELVMDTHRQQAIAAAEQQFSEAFSQI
jgi:hypothetical protein